MKFVDFCYFLERLEGISGRLEITDVLVEFLKKLDVEESDKAVYLILGGLAPKFKKVDFNLAEKQVMKAIARESEMDLLAVKKLYKEKGDLGGLIQEVKKTKNPSEESILDVFLSLKKIALEEGAGSQERKLVGLSDLLSSVGALEARFIVRIVLSKLRLGFSDKTVLDAISVMESGDKSHRKKLDYVFQILPDAGKLVKEIKLNGLEKATDEIRPEVGIPVWSELCQRLNTSEEIIEKMGEVAVEPKFDGTRCIGGHTGLLVKDKGFISVRELKRGDRVFTHKGKFKEIEGISKRFRRPDEKVFELLSYLGTKFKVSEGHKLLMADKEDKILKWIPVEKIKDEWLFFPKPMLKKQHVPEEKIFVDKAGYRKNVKLDIRFFRFLGYWVGDGFSNTSHQMERVGLVFNKKYKKLINSYKEIIKDVLHIEEVSEDVRNGAVILYWRDPVLRKWLCNYFRKNSCRNGDSGKDIPEWFWGLDRKRFLSFMKGWREADGIITPSGGWKIVTKERHLAMMAQLLGFKNGYPIGVKKIRARPDKHSVWKTYYEVICAFTDRYVKTVGSDGYLIKIRSLNRYKVNGKLRLYDIQVRGDSSFCTSVATLHNCQIHYDGKKVRTFTRNLDENSHMFPELKDVGKSLNAKSVILDCEAVGFDKKTGKLLPFQMTITRKRKHGIEGLANDIPLRFYVFDILYKDNVSLIDESYEERRNVLAKTIKENDVLVIDDFIKTDSVDEVHRLHEKFLVEGLEGAVIKKWDGKYLPGRQGWNWVKIKESEGTSGKLADTLDLVVMGYFAGKGKRAEFGIGKILVGVRTSDNKIMSLTKVGTGFTETKLVELKERLDGLRLEDKPKDYVVDKNLLPDVWVEPEQVVEIAADEITKSPIHSSGYSLRFPKFIKFRDDKDINGATNLREIKEMVRMMS